jgi:polyphosphate glucokinase
VGETANTEARTILTVDVGGTNVKVKCSSGDEVRKAASGSAMTAERMVTIVRDLTQDWTFDVVSIGYPGPVIHGRVAREPYNLGPGWMDLDFVNAFGKPVRIINDAAMQALGGYDGGRMLFVGLGTGMGSALIIDSIVQSLELAHLPYRKGRTYEDYLGKRGQRRLGKKRWRKAVTRASEDLLAAFQVDYLVIGGGEAKKLKELPTNCRLGSNADAFSGGLRLWNGAAPTSRRIASLRTG